MLVEHLLQLGVLPLQRCYFTLKLPHALLFLQFLVQLRPVVYGSVDGVVSGMATRCKILLFTVSGVFKLTLLYVQLLDHYRHGRWNSCVPRQLQDGLRLRKCIAIHLLDHIQTRSGIN